MRHVFVVFITLILLGCKEEEKSPKSLKTGTYRATLKVQDDKELPFLFKVESPTQLKIFNAEEVIEVDEVDYRNDSIFIKAPVFEGYIAGAIDEKGTIKGDFIKESLDRVVPFTAEHDMDVRFPKSDDTPTMVNIEGVWEAVFSEGVEGDEYIAKGIFEQVDHFVYGTFRTTTGDYRYLEGIIDGNILKLSTFDGAHAFYFEAKVEGDDLINGTFYSGNHWKEPFTAKRNADYELPAADSLTFLKDGYDAIAFSFPNEKGEMVSLSDARFNDKVVVVQIMGTWCPNCLDESKYYVDYYKQSKARGDDFEFIALAFEYAKTEDIAFSRIQRLKEKIGISYPVLLAQYGSSDKAKAQEKLPMLNHVLSYPTSIFIDKTGKVRKIHTGFNGPATGEKYTEFKAEFEGFVKQLLEE